MVLEQAYGVPQVINDGVSIARAITLEDPFENAGAQLIKEVMAQPPHSCTSIDQSISNTSPALWLDMSMELMYPSIILRASRSST